MARDAEMNHRTDWAVDAEGQLRTVCRDLRRQLAAEEEKHAAEVAALRAEIAMLRGEGPSNVRPLRVAGGRP